MDEQEERFEDDFEKFELQSDESHDKVSDKQSDELDEPGEEIVEEEASDEVFSLCSFEQLDE